MAILKTTSHILQAPFEPIARNPSVNFLYDASNHVASNENIAFEDIKYWQQLYYDPGLIGVYIAHRPKCEVYLIAYNMFVQEAKGIEVFSGEDAVLQLLSKCKELNIELPIEVEWKEDTN